MGFLKIIQVKEDNVEEGAKTGRINRWRLPVLQLFAQNCKDFPDLPHTLAD